MIRSHIKAIKLNLEEIVFFKGMSFRSDCFQSKFIDNIEQNNIKLLEDVCIHIKKLEYEPYMVNAEEFLEVIDLPACPKCRQVKEFYKNMFSRSDIKLTEFIVLYKKATVVEQSFASESFSNIVLDVFDENIFNSTIRIFEFLTIYRTKRNSFLNSFDKIMDIDSCVACCNVICAVFIKAIICEENVCTLIRIYEKFTKNISKLKLRTKLTKIFATHVVRNTHNFINQFMSFILGQHTGLTTSHHLLIFEMSEQNPYIIQNYDKELYSRLVASPTNSNITKEKELFLTIQACFTKNMIKNINEIINISLFSNQLMHRIYNSYYEENGYSDTSEIESFKLTEITKNIKLTEKVIKWDYDKSNITFEIENLRLSTSVRIFSIIENILQHKPISVKYNHLLKKLEFNDIIKYDKNIESRYAMNNVQEHRCLVI